MKTALILLHPGFEELEAIAPIDLLARAGVEVVHAAVGGELLVKGRSGIVLQASCQLADVAEGSFDLVLLPGGPGIAALRQDPLICDLLRRQHAAGGLIGCICAAPLLLLDAGLTDGLELSCHPSAEAELPQSVPHTVVESGNIITSRGAGTAIEFGLALVARLSSEATASEIAVSICWKDE